MTVTRNPFGTHVEDGYYLHPDGTRSDETFESGESYLIHLAGESHGEEEHSEEHGTYATEPGNYPGYVINEEGFILKKFVPTNGEYEGSTQVEAFGPKAFGALFFFITGFHGFHVFSGVLFLCIICINAASGVYASRKNGYEMVEKIGLYWHFVDLVWVFVFLVFYLL
jgi:cytochrome c oxidase subunit 3